MSKVKDNYSLNWATIVLENSYLDFGHIYSALLKSASIPLIHVRYIAKENMFCNTLQHTATHCNTLQHTATHESCVRYIAKENIF